MILEGGLDVEIGDGTRRVFGAGDILLAGAMPEVFAATVRDIVGFARSVS